MIGTLIQYLLYGVFWLTILLAVGGGLMTYYARQGRQVAIDPWLAGLALIAASAPYLGLFGTVWHIIQALAGLGTGNLNVAAIAHPIGQALYATLWGLGCAIPALVAHRLILLLGPVPEEALAETPVNPVVADSFNESAED